MDGNILQRDCTASSDSASPTTGVVVTRAHYIYIICIYKHVGIYIYIASSTHIEYGIKGRFPL